MSLKATNGQFRRMFDANYDAVHAYCLRRLPPEEAADATSEVFLVAWRRIDSVPAGAAARLWLFGVARNVVRNAGRSSRRQLRAVARLGGLAPARAADPQTQVVAASEHRELMATFRLLKSSDQEVLQLRLWEEISVAEVAIVLDCREKAASKRYQRAVTRLARGVGEPSVKQRMRPHLAPGGGEQ